MKKPPTNRWVKMGLFIYAAPRKDGRLLNVTVTANPRILGGHRVVIASEQAADADLNAALEDHAHLSLGNFPSVPAAKRAALDFVKRWRSGVELAKCACGPIEGVA